MKIQATLKWGMQSNIITESFDGWSQEDALANMQARFPEAKLEVVETSPSYRCSDFDYEQPGY